MSDYYVPIRTLVCGVTCLVMCVALQLHNSIAVAAGVLATLAGSTMIWTTRKRKLGEARSLPELIAETIAEVTERNSANGRDARSGSA